MDVGLEFRVNYSPKLQLVTSKQIFFSVLHDSVRVKLSIIFVYSRLGSVVTYLDPSGC